MLQNVSQSPRRVVLLLQVVIGLAILLSTGITGLSSRAGRRRRPAVAAEAAIG
jgi:hypothetical protein